IRRHHLGRSRDGGVWSDLWNAADEEAALVFDDQRPLEELASSGFLRLQRDDGTGDDEGSPQITAEHQTLPLWKAEGYARSVRLSICHSSYGQGVDSHADGSTITMVISSAAGAPAANWESSSSSVGIEVAGALPCWRSRSTPYISDDEF